ncbi:hypothetical protein Glove_83g30 [Diversispora epigaea]|uniref:Uncharacterized protein n=1 Tax=Diversispora epigaea TaxID=1348612 RepID=A0A397JB34_9GLOM|nr:hypothetical protein Glove_83g30 [Diversispora epigaea]
MNPVIYSFNNEYENLLNLSDNIQSEELNNIQINQVSDQIFNTQLIQTPSISLPPGISKVQWDSRATRWLGYVFYTFNSEKVKERIMVGKIVIVTGANTGIGFITARELARKNAHIYRFKIGSGSSGIFLDRKLPLHILVNNVGIMCTPFTLTEDGIQDQFGTNHIGHFLFIIKLLPTIEASAPSRIINLSSMAHGLVPKCGIDFENINNPNAYSPLSRYSQSKLANILFSLELNKRLADKEVYVNSVHPGLVRTELFRNLKDSMGFLAKPINIMVGLFRTTAEEGAISGNYLRGKYFVPGIKLSKPGKSGTDEILALKLWEYSEELINKKLNS